MDALYKNPKKGLFSTERLFQRAKEEGFKVTRKQVRDVLSGLREHELFRPIFKREPTSIVERGVGKGYQMDLLDMQKLSRLNKGNKWILIAVDITSRRGWAVPVHRKTSANMKEGIAVVLKDGIPDRVTSDNGKEFTNNMVQSLFQKHKIVHYTNQIQDHETLGIIDRFSRTLKQMLNKWFEITGELKWVEVLPSLIENYNTVKHRTIKQKPMDVWKRRRRSRQVITHAKLTYLPGTRVRTANTKALFEKEGQNWSDTIYVVTGRQGNKYVVRNKNGTPLKKRFRQRELLPTKQQEKEGVRKLKKKVEKTHKIEKKHKREDIKQENIRTSKRIRKKRDFLVPG